MNKDKKENHPVADSYVDIKKLCVSVSCGEYYGCGTVYDSDENSYTIVTAKHVLQDYYDGASEDIIVKFENNESGKASILNENIDLDIVFLGVGKNEISTDYYSVSDISSSSSVSSKSDGTLYSGQTIYLVDANTGDIYAGSIANPSVYSEDFAMDMIYCYCAVTPGMSGTGLFDEAGNYLGILLGGSDEAEAVCLTASLVRQAYQ
ncbi:S1 family peptidase [Butyrivibrio sp. XPD2006]|uniref:S1 family peptidase n=1 Tax=Butyrivibrio sp. XPD2006 TaxID=1280668 RepID=UPI0003B6AEA8|nr:serine protease [Butyrivibrio sp. XPD2006]